MNAKEFTIKQNGNNLSISPQFNEDGEIVEYYVYLEIEPIKENCIMFLGSLKDDLDVESFIEKWVMLDTNAT